MNLLPFLIFKTLFFFTLCLLSLQAHALTLTLEERAWIEQNPSITLGSDYAWAPYDFVDQQNQHAGISADIIEIIRQKTGLDIQIKSGVWVDIIANMQAGRLDGLVCAVQTPERDAYLNFTPPYALMPLAIVIRTDYTNVQSIDDLKGRTVGVNDGSYLHEWLKINHPDIVLVLTDSNEQALDFVSFGKVDAYIGNVAVATYVIRQKYLTNLKIVAKVDGLETETSIAIAKSQPILMSIMQKALAEIKPEVIRAINEKWFFQIPSIDAKGVILTPKEQAWMRSHGQVSVASEHDWPPFNFMDDSQTLVGLSLDYLVLAAQKTGLKLNITADDWTKNLSDLEHKKVDLLPAAAKNKDRERYAIFTAPYFQSQDHFFIRDDLQVEDLIDLDGKTVALPKGFSSISLIQLDYPNILILETASVQASIEAVLQNKAQVLYGTYPSISYSLKKMGVHSIMPFKATQKSQNLHFMVRKDAPELVSILNKGLAAMSNAEKEQIYDKWLSKPPTEPGVKLTDQEQQWMNEFGVINVVSTRNWPPFNFMDDTQKLVGFSLDYLALVAQKTGLKLNVTADDWSSNLNNLEHKKIDLLPAGAKNKDRERYAIFSDSYFKAQDYFFIRDDLQVERLSDLDGKTVALPKGYASIPVIQRDYPNILILETASVQASIEAVLQNKAQMLYGLYPTISYRLRKTGVNSILPFKATPGRQNLNFMVRKDAPELVSILNKGLVAMSKAEKEKIYDKWLLKPPSEQNVKLTDQERAWVASHGSIAVSAEFDWPPFDFVDKAHNPVGLSMDYLALIAQKTGLRLKITAGLWVNNLSNLEHKKTDLLPAVLKTDERTRFALFSAPYFEARNYFFIRDDLQVSSLGDLKGKTVAIPKGFSSILFLQKNYPDIHILETESMQEAIEAVIQNKAQMLFDIYPVLSYSIKEAGVNSIVPFRSLEEGKQHLRFMVRNDAPELLSILNKGLASISRAERAELNSSWLAKRPKMESKIELNEAERAWLQENSSIRFTGDPDWLPFEAFTKEGKYTGIVSDFLKNLEQKLPLQFDEIAVDSWKEALALANQKKIDVISGDVEDAYLAQHYLPIEPYINTPIVIIMEESAEFVGSLSELQDQTIAMVEGYGYTHALLNTFTEHDFKRFDSPLEVLESVSSGRSDAAVLSFPVASYLMKQHGFHHLKIVGKTDLEMNLTLFVSKDQPILHQILDKAMHQVREERGEEILNVWTKLSFASKVDYWLIFKILLVALFLIGFVFYWNLKLSKEIKQRKLAEKQLNVEKNKFKHLFEQAADGHLIFQRNQFVACNNAALMLLGLKNKEALLGQDVTNWSPEFQPDGAHSATKRKQFIQKCFNEGIQRFDWMLKDIYGHTFWVDVVYTSIPYLGKPAIYISWRDKTEQKALESTLKQNEEQITLLIENIPLIVIVSSVDGTILSANRKALDDYKMTPKALSELNISRFYQNSGDRKKVHKMLKSQGKVNQKIITMRNFHGETREMMVSVIPLKYNNQSAFLTIAVDLTDRILAEKQLKEAMESAEAANHSKTEFLANMSHEIRTPMNAILGFTELLKEQVKEPRLKAFINTIQSAGNTLLMLINDILDLSKIEAGKMTLQQVATNPHELFKEVGDIFAINIQKKGLDFYINIDPDIPPSLLLDPVRLRQVLFNLLGNAVKFTETGFVKLSVKLVIAFDHLSKVNLLITVEDTGIGIPKDQQDRIFNVFEQQSGQDSGKFGGTGLGLSITKRLVAMMKGHLSVESEANKGSTFSILLEKVDVASVHSHKVLDASLAFNANRVRFKHATILVVDDVLDNRELICQNFINSGLDIIEAENGQEAIDLYKANRIDLILMDIRMPVLNGYEAAKVIKKLNSDVPIIALTASVMQDEFEKIRRASFDDFLRKPVLRNDLIETLAQFLEYREAEPEEIHELSNGVDFDAESLSGSLKATMKIELGTLYESALQSNSIEDIKAFAKQIACLAIERDNNSLDRFASQLLEKVDSFDIAGMQFLLKKADFLLK